MNIKTPNQNTFPNKQQTVGSKSCGPVCLANIYSYFGVKTDLKKILKDLDIDDRSTTYPAQLAIHIMSQGLETVFLNSNPFTVSPDWKEKTNTEIIERLGKWLKLNKKNRWYKNCQYLHTYLKKGGQFKITDLTTKLIDEYINKGYLILCCIEESWIWEKRKITGTDKYHDVKGAPRGHFIVLYGEEKNDYLVSDPFPTGLKNKQGLYKLNKDKLLISSLVWTGQIVVIKTLPSP